MLQYIHFYVTEDDGVKKLSRRQIQRARKRELKKVAKLERKSKLHEKKEINLIEEQTGTLKLLPDDIILSYNFQF